MRFHGIDMAGTFRHQILSELPSHVISDEGRDIYLTNGTRWWATSTAWVEYNTGGGTGSGTIGVSTFDVTRSTTAATAGQTVFNLSGNYILGTDDLEVFINGVRPDAFTETDTTTITFTEALEEDDIVVVDIGTESFITAREIDESTVDQTVFTLSTPYQIGANALMVYINGIYQHPSSYDQTDSTHITFSDPIVEGDRVMIENTNPIIPWTYGTVVASEGQTLIAINDTYNLGESALMIFVNGVFQEPGAYVETSPTTILFTEALYVGDVVSTRVNTLAGASPLMASSVSISPSGNFVGNDVQEALDELYVDKYGLIGEVVSRVFTPAEELTISLDRDCVNPVVSVQKSYTGGYEMAIPGTDYNYKQETDGAIIFVSIVSMTARVKVIG
jgi:hypothetical protein